MAPRTWACRVSVAAGQEDIATALLWELGTLGLEERGGEAGRRVLLAYFAAPEDPTTAVEAALAEVPGVEVSPDEVPDVNWVARFREGFRPFSAAGFRIVPAWEAPATLGRETLLVDPGRAFGTGTHETTRLCLEALRQVRAAGPLGATLDVGAGTGILSLAASRLGARPVVAVDFDPEAVDSCLLHARLNGVSLACVLADGAAALRPRSFSLVFANVTAPLLEARSPEIAGAVSPRGSLVLSGFLREDAERLRSSYAAAWPGSTSPASRLLVDGEWAAWLLGGP